MVATIFQIYTSLIENNIMSASEVVMNIENIVKNLELRKNEVFVYNYLCQK